MWRLSYRTLYLVRAFCKLLAGGGTLYLGATSKRFLEGFPSGSFDVGRVLARISAHSGAAERALLGLAVVAVAKAIELLWVEPRIGDADIVQAAMRHLYQQLFGPNPGQRITFMAKRMPWARRIRPRYRYAYGQGHRFRSSARFAKGRGLAGIAWDSPGGGRPYVEPNIPEFADGDVEAFRNYYRTQVGMTRCQVRHLSADMRKVRWIFSYGIVHSDSHECIGVLSIDSRHAGTYEQVNVAEVLQVAAIIASVIRT